MLWMLASACTGPERPAETDDSSPTVGETGAFETGAPETGETGLPWETGETGGADPVGPPNVLFVVSDDLGLDVATCYDGIGSEKPPQPVLSSLCDQGVVFENATSYPVCSPTRATVFTGRYGFRTGLTEALDEEGRSPALSADEVSLPEVLAELAPDIATASFGKWHLSRELADPNEHGWPHFSGHLDGQLDDYMSWDKVVDGKVVPTTEYATSVNVDDVAAWIDDQPGQWFAWLGFNAPHAPFHAPPDDLHGYELDGSIEESLLNKPTLYRAMISAMDSEIGRLLDGLSDEVRARTWVVYLGDNGTPREVNLGDYKSAHAKATLYQGGVHVPLLIHGPDVVDGGRRVAAQVDTVDLFPTILQLLDVDVSSVSVALDGVGLEPYLLDPGRAPLQDWAFAELSGVRTQAKDAGVAVRGERYKLVQHEDGDEELYDLEGRFEEEGNLLDGALSEEQQEAYDALLAVLVDLGRDL